MVGKPQIDGSLRVSVGSMEQMQRFWETYQLVDGLGRAV